MKQFLVNCFDPAPTPWQTLLALLRDPVPTLIHQWNWKSAIFSSLCRAAIFFFANLSSGMDAAIGALITELLYRSVSAGFVRRADAGVPEV